MLTDILLQLIDRTPASWRSRSPTAQDRIWGDGLLDQSLTDTLYPCSWSDIGEDELVFLYPSLACQVRSAQRVDILSLLIRLALRSLADHSQQAPDASVRRRPCPASPMLSGGNAGATGLHRASTASQAQASPAKRVASDFGCLRANEQDRSLLENWVVQCLDNMLRDVTSERGGRSGSGSATTELPEALVASIYTCVNGAYVYPQFAFGHEILTTGAWLGVLMRGRAALMPPVVAQVLRELLPLHPHTERRELGVLTELLWLHAEHTVGTAQLLRKAKTVLRSGRDVLVVPS